MGGLLLKQKILAYMRDDQVITNLKEEFEVYSFNNQEYLGDPAFDQALQKVDGIIGLALNVTKQLIEAAPNLKIVSNCSVGYDNLHIPELTKRNIMATNTPDILNDTTADAIFAILLAT